jgi:hypothetical protein
VCGGTAERAARKRTSTPKQLLFKFTVAVAQPQCPAAVMVTAIVRTVRRGLFIFEEFIRVTDARERMFFLRFLETLQQEYDLNVALSDL